MSVAHFIEAQETKKAHSVVYPSRRAFLVQFERRADVPMLFVPTFAPAEVGEAIALKVSVHDRARNFYVEGVVESVQVNGSIRAGYTLAFKTAEHQRSVAPLVAFCSRRKEAGQRFVTDLGIRVTAPNGAFDAVVRDISVSGVFVETDTNIPLKIGTAAKIELRHGLFGLHKTVLSVEILWHGPKRGKLGFGGRFVGISEDDVERLLRGLGIIKGKAR